MIKNFVKNISSLFVPEIKDSSQNVYRYGNDNLLPNNIIRYINDSGIAKRCVNKVATYTQGDGFVDENTKTFKVNEKQTADGLLSSISFDVAYFKGFALNIGRDAFGKAVSVKHIPFQYVRKTLKGDFLVNMTLGTKDYRKDRNEYFPSYMGVQITTTQLAAQVQDKQYGNKGEIYYVFISSPDNPQYPVPDFYAAIEDIRTSSELQKFDLESVLNGFVPSAILTLVGAVDDTTEDEDGKTQKDYQREALSEFTGYNKDVNGLSGRNSLLVLEAANKDEVPSLQTFDAKAIIDASNTKRDVVDRAVCRLFGVHPVLVGFSDAAVLGNTQAIANASQEMNVNVNALQRMIERAMKNIFPEMNWELTKFIPVTFIPPDAYGKLTDDEIRALFGYKPLPVIGVPNEKLLVEKLGVGGTQAFTTIIADVNLSAEQKRATLKLLFGLSDEDAMKLVPEINLPQ